MGGSVVALAWMANVVCMLLIAIAAWKDGASSPSLVGPLLGASLPILVLPLAFMSPGDLGYVVFLAVPLTALTWLWVAVAWLRGMGPPPAVSGPSG